ncbi:MAG: hypothetical protein K2X86_05745 [Cytophagaceae bacterium]|nr:hypothetical protein [Cytophagaceae bacterium]
MRVRRKYEDKEVVYFCTFTCYNWLPLFELTDFYNEVYKWFDIYFAAESPVGDSE